MARIAYVNGKYVPSHLATVAMEDRGYQFADGVYEVAAFINNRLLDEAKHLDRLERSLEKLEIPMPMARGALIVKIAIVHHTQCRRIDAVHQLRAIASNVERHAGHFLFRRCGFRFRRTGVGFGWC